MPYTWLKSGQKVAENDVFVAYNTLYNKVEVTEFYYKSESAFRAAATLHEVKHLNVLRSIKVDSKSRKIVTEQIQPFSCVLSTKDRVFNKHCAHALAHAVSFLHNECKIAHNNIVMDALFVTNNLNFVLGSFERSSRQGSFQKDADDFQRLLSTFSLTWRPIGDVLKDKTWHSEFLGGIEAFMHEFTVLKLREKEERVRSIARNAKILNTFFKERIAEKLILELKILKEKDESSGEGTRLYREMIAKVALELDMHRDTALNELFVILDPALRVFLLKNVAASRVPCLNDKAMECMLLGTRCKDSKIQALTIDFISRGYDKLSEKQKAAFIKSARLLRDRETLGAVCTILLRHADLGPQVSKETCRLIDSFLHVEEMCLEVLPLLKIYYKSFSYADICRKVIVVLFELVRHRDSQASAFEAIDLLVLHLKTNKKQIIDKEWRLSCIKALFSQRKGGRDPNIQLSLGNAPASESACESETEHKAPDAADDGWSNDW
ncbi:UNVERIFIED_CONTAM: hypothetical protein PYX00_011858 [Menopon gallinae]|uniref:Protein kinase domain-containing protein n=1 Tax=Menopon gallinae TaxID=328185 RepID=A0AAW2H8X9_9NEOP